MLPFVQNDSSTSQLSAYHVWCMVSEKMSGLRAYSKNKFKQTYVDPTQVTIPY